MPLFLIARIADQGVVFDADQVDRWSISGRSWRCRVPSRRCAG
jgi:hypothetical protein